MMKNSYPCHNDNGYVEKHVSLKCQTSLFCQTIFTFITYLYNKFLKKSVTFANSNFSTEFLALMMSSSYPCHKRHVEKHVSLKCQFSLTQKQITIKQFSSNFEILKQEAFD